MKALFIQHDHVSPTGPVSDRLREHGFEVEEREVVSEDNFRNPNVHFEFPPLAEYDLIVPLGAPWGAWDDACIGNWLQPELEWVREAVTSNKPVLGICFGGQLIARAMGGSVARAPQCEIGWKSIWSDRPEIVSDGPWFQFHYDRWVLPPGATEIARNPIASQAFIMNRTLGVQFHPEINTEALTGWLKWDGDELVEADGQDPAIMLEQTRAYETAARQRTMSSRRLSRSCPTCQSELIGAPPVILDSVGPCWTVHDSLGKPTGLRASTQICPYSESPV